jgi:hypothetical protein
MPKQSYAQEVADLEEALAAVRVSAEILLEIRGKAQIFGANLPAHQRAASQAA